MIPLQSLPDALTDPFALGVLTVVLVALVEYQKGLGWYEYRAIHRFKVAIAPALDGYIFILSNKGGHDDAEYITTLQGTVKGVFKALVGSGGSPHLINSIKQRPHPDGDGVQYSVAHVVFTQSDETQLEVYLFREGNGVAVYAHHEVSPTDPDGHLGDGQQDGDPRGVLPKWVTEA